MGGREQYNVCKKDKEGTERRAMQGPGAHELNVGSFLDQLRVDGRRRMVRSRSFDLLHR